MYLYYRKSTSIFKQRFLKLKTIKAIPWTAETSLRSKIKQSTNKSYLNFQVNSAKEQKDESLHGEALHKIAHLERKKQSAFGGEEETIAAAPNFVVGLQGKTSLIEGT